MPEGSRFQDLTELARMLELGEISEREFEIVRAELYPERYGSPPDPAIGFSETTELDRRWYQKTWLWIGVAFLAVPLTVAWVVLSPSLGVGGVVYGVGLSSISALVPVGLWMGALVSKRAWGLLLSIPIALLFFLATWSVWNFVQNVESLAQEACQLIETAAGEIVELDPEQCESTRDGTLDTFLRRAWILVGLGFGVLWFAPLVILYFLRKRLQPDDVVTGKGRRVAEVAGFVLVTLGGLFMAFVVVISLLI